MVLESRFDSIQVKREGFKGFFNIFMCVHVSDSYLVGVLYFYMPTTCFPIYSKLPFSVNS